MQWAWATSLDQLWRSPSLPMWATLIAAGFFALVVLIVLLRADKTMANGALAVIALLAIGIASTTTVRGFGPPARIAEPAPDSRVSTAQVAAAPALACLDGLAGESVEAACEKAVFGSADTAAAAVSYTASQVSRVVATGSARTLSPEQQVLKRTVERDRFGLVAQVIAIRDRCIITDCPLFRVLSDSSQIKSNMSERHYDALVTRYSSSWTSAAATPQAQPASSAAAASMLTGVPSGRPTSIDFANSASIPPVNIMTSDQPQAGATPPAKQQAAPAAAPPAKQQAAPPAKQQAAAPATAPAAKSANVQAQTKRPPANAQATSGQTSAPAAASIGRPRVVAPVPYVPSQVGDENEPAAKE
jgi:hypothetical protein